MIKEEDKNTRRALIKLMKKTIFQTIFDDASIDKGSSKIWSRSDFRED